MKDALGLGNRWIDLVLLLWEHLFSVFYGDTPPIIYFFQYCHLSGFKSKLKHLKQIKYSNILLFIVKKQFKYWCPNWCKKYF